LYRARAEYRCENTIGWLAGRKCQRTTGIGNPVVGALVDEPLGGRRAVGRRVLEEAGIASPYYLVAPAQSPFGAFNSTTNPSATGTRSLQASLAINRTGASQTSALVVQTGSFFTSSDTGTVAGDGVVRGSFAANGTTPPVRIGSGAATVPDGNGSNIFGTGTGSLPISGFVLDQNQYNPNQNFVPNQLANQVPLGGATSTYAFNQPATRNRHRLWHQNNANDNRLF
jgi:hypothetical protein